MARPQRDVMMRRAEISQPMTVRELVDNLYGGGRSEAELQQAERALLTANPHLRGRETLSAGTSLAVPNVGATAWAPGRQPAIRLTDAPEVSVSSSGRALAGTEGTMQLVERLKRVSRRSPARAARLVAAEREVKRRIADDELLDEERDLIAERVWQDLAALLAVARGAESDGTS